MRPTARGVGAVLAGGALLGTGLAVDYLELAILGAAALFAAALALVYTASRPRLVVHREVDPDRVTRGEMSTQTLTVGNARRLRMTTLLAQDLCGGQAVPVPLLRLRRGQDTVVSYPVPTQRRGVVRVGPLTVRRRDPLGLVASSSTHGGTTTVWVYPRTHRLAAVPAGIARSLDGRVDKVPHGSITFDTLREYVIGDELRHVHWRTTARVGELMVREHLDTSLPRIVVLLDDRAAAYPEPDAECFEHACEAAASVLVAAVREELPVDLLTVAGAQPEAPRQRARRAEIRPLLDRLAEAQPASTQHASGTADPFATAVRRLRQQRLGDTLVFLTGTGRTDDLAALGALRPGYPVIVAGVFGDPDRAPSTVEDLHLLAVPDAAAFALAWDGIGQW